MENTHMYNHWFRADERERRLCWDQPSQQPKPIPVEPEDVDVPKARKGVDLLSDIPKKVADASKKIGEGVAKLVTLVKQINEDAASAPELSDAERAEAETKANTIRATSIAEKDVEKITKQERESLAELSVDIAINHHLIQADTIERDTLKAKVNSVLERSDKGEIDKDQALNEISTLIIEDSQTSAAEDFQAALQASLDSRLQEKSPSDAVTPEGREAPAGESPESATESAAQDLREAVEGSTEEPEEVTEDVTDPETVDPEQVLEPSELEQAAKELAEAVKAGNADAALAALNEQYQANPKQQEAILAHARYLMAQQEIEFPILVEEGGELILRKQEDIKEDPSDPEWMKELHPFLKQVLNILLEIRDLIKENASQSGGDLDEMRSKHQEARKEIKKAAAAQGMTFDTVMSQYNAGGTQLPEDIRVLAGTYDRYGKLVKAQELYVEDQAQNACARMRGLGFQANVEAQRVGPYTDHTISMQRPDFISYDRAVVFQKRLIAYNYTTSAALREGTNIKLKVRDGKDAKKMVEIAKEGQKDTTQASPADTSAERTSDDAPPKRPPVNTPETQPSQPGTSTIERAQGDEQTPNTSQDTAPGIPRSQSTSAVRPPTSVEPIDPDPEN